jgi:hypothetical protein
MNAEQHRILSSKPLGRMRWFASLLGWHGLQLELILFAQDEIAKWNVPASGLIVFYMTTDWKFNLQINERPTGQAGTHQATIKADRYGIKNIGWHPFTLFDDDDDLRREAERLRPWLDRNLYKNRRWLRLFKTRYPEMLLATRKKGRGHPRSAAR